MQSGDTGSDDRKDRSDFFSVGDAKRAIPKITAVPKTKEEVQRQRMVRIALAVAAVVTSLLATWLALHLHHRSSIDAARVAVERSGRPAAIAEALALVEGETGAGDVALAARLHATAELAGIEGHRESAERLLTSHDPSGEGASDHLIAQTYLALARGDASAAAQHASALVARGPRAAEAGHARALVALAIGNLPQALAAAQAAAQELEGAPRHQALLALVSARSGSPIELEGDEVAIRLARARVRWLAGEQRDTLGADLAPLAADESASPAERAWARLLVGLSAIEEGRTEAATAAITEAAASPPPGDEVFRVQLAEGWLALGRRSEAQAIADALSPGISADAGRRAQLVAELHLASAGSEGGSDALARAESELERAPADARTALLRARVADARGQVAQARTLYDEAAAAPPQRLPAIVGLASMLVRTGAAADAVARVTPLLDERPTHPRIAAIATDAYAGVGDRARALAIAGRALEAYPREPLILAAKARVHLAASEWQPALEALRVATEVTPRDATLQAERGRAAMELGQLDEARQAFEAALELDPAHAAALRSLLSIQLQQRDLDGAGRTVARIDAAGVSTLEIEQLRARWLVDTLAGASGLNALRRARRAARRDRALAYALGQLHMQAERWYDALDAFGDATPDEGTTAERRDVLLWRVLAFARARREATVEQLAEGLRESEEPLTPQEESRLLTAEAWIPFLDATLPRAMILLRRALSLDESNAEAQHLMGVIEELQRREDPPARWRRAIAASPASVEAYGRLARNGEMDAERCGWARRYLRAAPEGALAGELRGRVGTCPAE